MGAETAGGDAATALPAAGLPPAATASALPAPVDLSDLLEPLSSRGIDLRLDRMAAALADGGHPERRFAAVQVAGTNGKGSITTFLEAILRASGLRCGAYRSPHLISWCERIRLDGRWIDPASLRAELARWRPIAERHNLTPFELFTAVAFECFASADLDLTVLEVGLGGRLDATTAHPLRPVLGFGAIGLDHCEHLGSTLAAIAAEKAGVLRSGAIAVSAAQEPEVAEVLEAAARRQGAELRWVDPLPPQAQGGPALGLAGAFQRANAAVAVGMARALAERGWRPSPGQAADRSSAWRLEETALRTGLAAARWPGRLELRRYRGQTLLIDGAHNPPAAAVLRRELDALAAGPRRWLLGMQRHKEGAEILRQLLAPGDRAWLVPIPEHRCWSRAELAMACPELAAQLEEAGAVRDGLERLLAPGEGPVDGGLPVVAGSLHLLGAVIPLLDPDRP
jgi:dihydrofolate synthase/folylpolyglutamate synthase